MISEQDAVISFVLLYICLAGYLFESAEALHLCGGHTEAIPCGLRSKVDITAERWSQGLCERVNTSLQGPVAIVEEHESSE